MGGDPLASDSLLEMTAKREYSKFQDVRKVIGFIYSCFESSELRKLSEEKEEEPEMRDVEPVVLMIANMPKKQKQILKQLMIAFERSL